MAIHAPVLEDDSPLSRLDRGLYRLERQLALVAGLTVFVLMLLAVISVGGRHFFNQPLPGSVDWIQQGMPLIAFLGIAYTQRDGGHIRMDILVSRLSGRALWAAETVTTLAMLVVMALLVWGSFAHFQRSFDWGAPLFSRDSSIDINLPLWPAKLLAPVAFSVLCLRLALQLWGYGRAFLLGLSAPVAVPLVVSVADQAASEATHVSGADD
ncbi:TRAP-type C4-dicarboxylate transport system permease small subunit [Rhodovulum sulfidophilum]|uniref:TRAP transporter small permease subunit n=1 Tax=Rhodovulum sulfidophilum TaxID=35806 RepID=UPI0005A83ACC|nr:TRAP transporter small permease [Rhodovulum sulfidophilum]ANB34959.1 C4-dicarboxylate ABC transporter permease [Rhodovulum sulfidophilum DSM 1374]ANB38781.1 C4-dicarboxylate ABC transporter permease [Rhodovulum sulfidophilum]MCW2302290.1 TRAP-type C4-dicarboxylate transport system permease small subunit [Rhodovulum sulfidophilum]